MQWKLRRRFTRQLPWVPFVLLLLVVAACTDDDEPRVPNADPQQVTDPPAPQHPPLDTNR